MRPDWMDPDEPTPTALCVTSAAARDALRWASDVPGSHATKAVQDAYAEAQHWCSECPVRDQCLTWALETESGDTHSRDGIYGGKTPPQRAYLATLAAREAAGRAATTCEGCGIEFLPGSPSARYCSNPCRRTVINRRQNVKRKAERAAARAGRAA